MQHIKAFSLREKVSAQLTDEGKGVSTKITVFYVKIFGYFKITYSSKMTLVGSAARNGSHL